LGKLDEFLILMAAKAMKEKEEEMKPTDSNKN
jgi:hypothetical protein